MVCRASFVKKRRASHRKKQQNESEVLPNEESKMDLIKALQELRLDRDDISGPSAASKESWHARTIAAKSAGDRLEVRIRNSRWAVLSAALSPRAATPA